MQEYFPKSIVTAGFKSFFDGKIVKDRFLDAEDKITDLDGMRKYEDECYAEFLDHYKLPVNDGKKNVLFLLADATGCGWVRGYLPSKYLHENSTKYNVICSLIVSVELVKWADIIVWQRQYQKNLLRFFKTAQDLGKIQLFDTDDNLHRVPSSNPASDVFNPEKEEFLLCAGWMKQSDKIIVSTKALKEFYDRALETNCTVIENSLPMIYDKLINNKDYLDKRTRIVWAGGSSHLNDLTVIRNAMYALKDKYGDNIKFTTIGFDGKLYTPVPEEKIPEETKAKMKPGQKIMQEIDLKLRQDKHIPWTEVDKYVERLCGMSHTIGLCPLLDNEFNRCKSVIKFIEYSQAGIATIASDVVPYNQAIVNEETGLLVENKSQAWFEAIERLSKDKSLARKLAKNALEFVKQKYDISKNWVQYEKLFDTAIEDHEKNSAARS